MEGSYFELVSGLCNTWWTVKHWDDCENMGELVDALQERTTTWTEKWRANYIAEGRVQGLAEGRVGLLVSMARQRFGEAVASTMSDQLKSVRTKSALEEVGTWLLTCETGDALIAKIRQM